MKSEKTYGNKIFKLNILENLIEAHRIQLHESLYIWL